MTCVMYFFGYKSFDVVKIKNVVVLNLTFPSSNSFLNFAELTKLGFEYFLKQFQRCKKKLFLQCNTLFHSDPKNPHCAGARTVPALYGCGPHSNLRFHGH